MNYITKFEYAQGQAVVFTASKDLAQPNKREYKLHANILRDNKITHILNVSAEHKANSEHRKWYQGLKIEYHELPIADYTLTTLGYFDNFLEHAVEWHATLPADAQVLIHCSAGINRSNAAAAAILWEIHAPTEPPTVFLEWMAIQQIKQRNLHSFITNPSLRCAFLKRARLLMQNPLPRKRYELRGHVSIEELAFKAVTEEEAIKSLKKRFPAIEEMCGDDKKLYSSLIREECILIYEHSFHTNEGSPFYCVFCEAKKKESI